MTERLTVVLSFVDEVGKDVEYRCEMDRGNVNYLVSDFLNYSTRQYEYWYDGQRVDDE